MKKLLVMVALVVVVMTGCSSNVREMTINVDDIETSDVIKMTNEINENYLYEYNITLTSYKVPIIRKATVKNRKEFMSIMKSYVK